MTCSKPENKSHFFAHLSRLSLINCWPLMGTMRSENVSEHTLQVAFVAHALAIIQNRLFEANFNAERVALLAMYHDVSEVLTGDMATPVKYHSPIARITKNNINPMIIYTKIIEGPASAILYIHIEAGLLRG